jgi:hypothetical protein
MKKLIKRRFTNERGIAMMTVIFVGAAMTAITSMAALATVKEFRAGTDDMKAAGALSYAEAGVDRSIQYLRGRNWGVLRMAGCNDGAANLGRIDVPSGAVGKGQFDAWIKVFNPTGTDTATRYADGSTSTACTTRPTTPKDPLYVVIHSVGSHPAAKRVVEQVVKVEAIGLPIGVYANRIDVGGTPDIYNISMVSETTIKGREKLVFEGCDPYYTTEDFWPEMGITSAKCGAYAPAAAHAVSGIYLKQNATNPEFAASPMNCTANNNPGASDDYARYQSVWDGDGTAGSGPFTGACGPWGNGPGTSKFLETDMERVTPRPALTPEDHEAIKQTAQSEGIYCSIGSTTSCTRLGVSIPAANVWQDGDVAPIYTAGFNNIIAYFDFKTGTETSNEIKWKADAWLEPDGCSTTNPELTKSAVIVVRNGGVSLQNGASINGALIMDGDFKFNGSVEFLGTIISKNVVNASGGMTFKLDSCWIQNMPTIFTSAQPIQWSEIDR